jgi:hypothetical protein
MMSTPPLHRHDFATSMATNTPNISVQHDPKNKKAKGRSKKLPSISSATHQAIVIDDSAPPPPDLPLKTIKAIAINQCHVPPSEVTEDRLNSTSG